MKLQNAAGAGSDYVLGLLVGLHRARLVSGLVNFGGVLDGGRILRDGQPTQPTTHSSASAPAEGRQEGLRPPWASDGSDAQKIWADDSDERARDRAKEGQNAPCFAGRSVVRSGGGCPIESCVRARGRPA